MRINNKKKEPQKIRHTAENNGIFSFKRKIRWAKDLVIRFRAIRSSVKNSVFQCRTKQKLTIQTISLNYIPFSIHIQIVSMPKPMFAKGRRRSGKKDEKKKIKIKKIKTKLKSKGTFTDVMWCELHWKWEWNGKKEEKKNRVAKCVQTPTIRFIFFFLSPVIQMRDNDVNRLRTLLSSHSIQKHIHWQKSNRCYTSMCMIFRKSRSKLKHSTYEQASSFLFIQHLRFYFIYTHKYSFISFQT